MQDYLSIYDLLLTPIYLGVVLFLAKIYEKSKIAEHPEYKYFTKGLMIKILGAFALGCVYMFYYSGGDTTNYFQSARAYVNLAFYNWDDFIEGWLGNPGGVNAWNYFNEDTGIPVYFHRDHHAFWVVRLLIPIEFIGANSYFCTSILVAFVTYTGAWKLYQTFLHQFPSLKKELAIACIYIPSCVFWGSGIMKDSFTLAAVGWYTYAFYHFFIQKNFNLKFALFIYFFIYYSRN
ncbi:MAG: hypothetical protein IPG89_21265 [Bacteroidetes bacterium]|nr:hypothetical protein [Bacteroidota bacterium]